MPRVKKPRRLNARKYKTYDPESMKKAVTDCLNGGSYKNVAKRYGINRTTLMNHVKGYKCNKVGRPTVLTHEEEETLVQSLVKLGEWGYGFDRLQLQRCVQDYLRRLDRPNPFNNGLPGLDWCLLFENRWKAFISRRVAQNLPRNRAIAGTTEVMEDMYEKLKSVITRLDLQNKPQNIFNTDEIGFQTDAGVQKVLCKKGSRNPNKLVGSVTKATYTVLMCCNAVGDFLPMFINYKGIHLYSTWCVNGPDKVLYNCSPSGWMEAPQFLDWFKKGFVKETSHLEGNKLLILDGHNSHISLELIETAMENHIEIFCLPAHTSHLLQPLDVGVYKSVKNSWRSILRQFYEETGYKNVDKLVFPSLMKKLAESGCLSRANAVGGFEGSGIYPLSKEKMLRKVETAEITSNNTSNLSTSHVLSEITNSPSTSHNDLNKSVTTDQPKESCNTDGSSSALQISSSDHNLTQALMSVLKVQNKKETNPGKRSRVNRKFAESLTSTEVVERLRLNIAKKQTKKEKNTKRRKIDIDSSSSDSNVSVILESEDEAFDNEPITAEIEIPPSDEVEVDDAPINTEANKKIEKGSWVLVKYGNASYVGKVIKIKGTKAETNFLRKRGLYFVYPDVLDRDEINLESIQQVLSDPYVQRGKHYFKITGCTAGTIIN